MGIRSKIVSKIREKQYSKYAHPTIFDWNWGSKGYNRIALVNYLVSKSGGHECKYLEIGCASNKLFDSVYSLQKIGVDPESGGTHRMTSDDFFDKTSQKAFDVIFIDGLHEYEQVRRDAINALNIINDDGWIAFHDFLPTNWKEQHIPRIQSAWTGDCWKLAIELSKAIGVDFYIVNIDCGVGLLRKSKKDFSVPDQSGELLKAKFNKFVEEVPNLPIVEYKEAIKIINSFS